MKVWSYMDEKELEDAARPVNMWRAMLGGIVFSICFGAFFWVLACL